MKTLKSIIRSYTDDKSGYKTRAINTVIAENLNTFNSQVVLEFLAKTNINSKVKFYLVDTEDLTIEEEEVKYKMNNKIIAMDNYNRDDISDILITNNVHKDYEETIVNFLQTTYGRENECYYRLVNNDHKLYGFDY